MRKMLSVWGMIFLMLVLVVGTAAAQSGGEGTPTPTVVPTSQPAGSTSYQHPIVQILSAYFGRATRPMLPTPSLTPTETPTVDPSATVTETPTVDPSATQTEVPSETPTVTPTATPMGPEDFAEQIAMYHQEGMGFGVLVKLYAMAEDAVNACLDQPVSTEVVDPTQPACEAVTVEQLVSEFQGGSGMGQLFKEYGKPALLGVGQVKKALRNQPEVVQSTPTPAPTTVSADPQAQTLDQKSYNGNGNSNGNGSGNSNSNGNGNSNSSNSNRPAKAKTPNPHSQKK